jgi:hypothetical protein
MSDLIPVHPVQGKVYREQSVVPQVVTLRAYEVYCHIYRPQPAMITGGCRGGFSLGEMIALLYARSFPKTEWDARFHEALMGMKHV